MADYSDRNDSGCMLVLIILLCLFFPPIPVYLYRGCSLHLLINVLLCVLYFIPGVIHAFLIVGGQL